MSLVNAPSIEFTALAAAVTDDRDELDIIHAEEDESKDLDARKLRPRKPDPANTNAGATSKRKRKLSQKALESKEKIVKKVKTMNGGEAKKAHAADASHKRMHVESSRRRFLLKQRHVFEPLLPPASMLFDNLQKISSGLNDKASVVPFHEVEKQPKLVQGQMKDYQLHGLSFLVHMYKNGMNCILGDEMGLGKTLQTLSLLAYIKETTKGQDDPHIIVCPLSVLSSWMNEAARFTPSLQTIRFHGNAPERARLKSQLKGVTASSSFDVLITTYDTYVAEDSWFKSRRWTYVVLDEGHKIKNSETDVASKLQGIGSLYRLILTGTPLQNSLLELWALLHWLYPTIFTQTSRNGFELSFNLTKGSYDMEFMQAAQSLLKCIMLRRTKATVEISVPPREEHTIFLPLSEAQRFWMYRLLTRLDRVDLEGIFERDHALLSNPSSPSERKKLTDVDQGREEVLELLRRESTGSGAVQRQWKRLMNLLLQLRKVCDHPYLLPNAEPDPFYIGEHIVAASSKMVAIDKILGEILPKGERILLFSQWTGMLDLLEDYMTLRGIPYARLDGQTSRPRRSLYIRLFQQDKSPYQVFLISTKAGGLGINLTKATTVIMCDSDWNPQNDLQAIARAHRIGQTKTVKVYRLICHGSVEDQMLDRIRRKLFLSVKVMGSEKPSSDESSSLGSSELLEILRRGSSALSDGSSGAMNWQRFLDAPFGDILEASRSKEDKRDANMKYELTTSEDQGSDEKLMRQVATEEKVLLSGVAQVQSRLFEGRLVIKADKRSSNKDIAMEWEEKQKNEYEAETGKRERVDRIVRVGGMEYLMETEKPLITAERKLPAKKKKGKSFEHEDWCIYCRDGGELVLCCQCPRVFHARCHGVTKAHVDKLPSICCSQHSCSGCSRTTSDAGGMLFRCQTCHQAFCEDCMPEGEMEGVGETLPEFQLLNYGEKSTAYYIRCHACREHFAENPQAWRTWEDEMRRTERKLQRLLR